MIEKDSAKNRKRVVVARFAKGIGALAVLIFLMLWLSGAFVKKVGPEDFRAEPSRQKPPTCKVERKTFPMLIEQVGSVRSRNEARISSRLMAQIRDIRVKEGDWVTGPEVAGAQPTVLATLDDRDVQAKLRQARSQVEALDNAIDGAEAKTRAAEAQVLASKANREKATSDYHRYENLLKSRATTEQQVQHSRTQRDLSDAQVSSAIQEVQASRKEIARLKAQREQAKAALSEAQVMLSYTIIEAPFSGRVIKKMVNPGDMMAPGQPVLFLETPSQVEFHAIVSESFLALLKLGQKMDVKIDALDRKTEGQITEIVPKADVATRTVLVKIGLPARDDLVNGFFGRIYIPYGTYDALVVPAATVREVGQLHLVDTIGESGVPIRRFITTGRTIDSLVEVLSGLDEGEEVVAP